MLRLIKWYVACALLALAYEPAGAATYYIDAFAPGGMSGTGGSIPVTGCPPAGCANGYATPFYSFQPGDTVNFGTIYLSPVLTTFTAGGPGGGLFDVVLSPVYVVTYDLSALITSIAENGASNVLVQCNVTAAGCSASVAAAMTAITTVALTFTLPSGATGIQVAWTSPYTYVSPVPMPAALPLFATGLGVLGLLGWRRKRKAAAAIA
jgi:hypothetical protein